jgi:isocitrate/isopropylmalate dehydrogenase
MLNKNKRVVGIIRGEATGPEIIPAAIETLDVLNTDLNLGLRFSEYDGPAPALHPGSDRELEEDLNRLSNFYAEIRDQGGVIIRSAIYAWLVYRLRERFNHAVKCVFFKPWMELEDLRLLKVEPNSIILVRENRYGLYHATEMAISRINGVNEVVRLVYEYNLGEVQQIARFAFQLASGNSVGKVLLLIKEDVLHETYKLWKAAFERARREIGCPTPWESDHPDAGMAHVLLNLKEKALIVTTDESGDTISDILGALIYGTRSLPASVNVDPATGFASYQTIHGAASDIAGKNIVNPLGMIEATALMCEITLQRPDLAELVRAAARSVLRSGLRTADMCMGPQKHVSVSTSEFIGEYIKQLRHFVASHHTAVKSK